MKPPIMMVSVVVVFVSRFADDIRIGIRFRLPWTRARSPDDRSGGGSAHESVIDIWLLQICNADADADADAADDVVVADAACKDLNGWLPNHTLEYLHVVETELLRIMDDDWDVDFDISTNS